jgi:hypothetical protein
LLKGEKKATFNMMRQAIWPGHRHFVSSKRICTQYVQKRNKH